jgi:GST-like protein
MSGLTLYGCPGSGSAAIEMALRQAGISYRSVRAASWEPGPGYEQLKTINPLGQIPTLALGDGLVLTESAAILIHLGLTAPGLLPGAPSARARAIRGLVFIAANCYSAVSITDFPERWTTQSDSAAIDAVRAAARVQLHQAWLRFADQFFDDPARPFLCGDSPGALDFLAVVVSKWSGTRAALKAEQPAFHAWLEALQRHPAVAGVHAEHWPG